MGIPLLSKIIVFLVLKWNKYINIFENCVFKKIKFILFNFLYNFKFFYGDIIFRSAEKIKEFWNNFEN